MAKIESYPVEIRYRFFFGSRPLDTLNTAAMAKMFEDALRSIGILEEDDPRHVAKSILEVAVIPRSKNKTNHERQSTKRDPTHEDYLELTIIPYVTRDTNNTA